MEIQDLLVDEISSVSLKLFEHGHYREAMTNAILRLFDLIRDESGLQEDGTALIGKALSIENPRIILADIQSESGKNIQKGTIQIIQGYFQAYRNVASHSLTTKFEEKDTLSVLIATSRLYEKIKSAEKGIFLRHDGLYFHADNEEGIHSYLRFYEDGTVISVPTTAEGDHSKIVYWFNKENAEDFKHFSHGIYETTGRTVQFYTESSVGRVNYSGIIRPKLLHVCTESLINGNKSSCEFKFINWEEIKSNKHGKIE